MWTSLIPAVVSVVCDGGGIVLLIGSKEMEEIALDLESPPPPDPLIIRVPELLIPAPQSAEELLTPLLLLLELFEMLPFGGICSRS